MRDKNYVRLGQIYQFVQKLNMISVNTLTLEKFETLICNGFDVNYQVPIDSLICQNKPEYSGNTALHFLAEINKNFTFCNSKYSPYIKLLIENGADVTIKNTNGLTPLLLAFNNIGNNETNQSVSLDHFNGENTINIRSENGISHFHVLCMTNNIEKVELFLKSGVDINERVNDDSPEYPGYTPLHFAAYYSCIEIIELLMKYGADLNISDARGMSPIHLIAKNYRRIINGHGKMRALDIICYNKIALDLNCNDKTTFKMMIFLKITILKSDLYNFPDKLGFCRLHFGPILIGEKISIDKFFDKTVDIDSPINFDSPIWPGCTPLHLAAKSRNLNAVKFLLEKGANILAENADGTTPLYIIITWLSNEYSVLNSSIWEAEKSIRQFKDLLHILINIFSFETRHKLSKLQLTDGTYLLDIMKAMTKPKKMKQFIKKNLKTVNTFIPLNSPLWPGYNLLHLQAIFNVSCVELVEQLGVDFFMINADGMSPLHLAFSYRNYHVMKKIYKYIPKSPRNLIDRNNVSYLHIICTESIKLYQDCLKIAECILKNGADPNISTINDFWFRRYYIDDNIDGFKGITMKSGTTPLHVAISEKNTPSAKLLLSYGANPCLADSAGVTPFQVALIKLTERESYFSEKIDNDSVEKLIAQMLESHGKDLMTGDRGVNILRAALSVLNNKYTDLLKKMITEFDCEKRHEELGLTKLQIACALGDFDLIKKELESGAADVNARIAFDSSVWPGYTALHILLKKFRQSRDHYIIIDLLLKHGVDTSLKNAENLTPFHLNQDYFLQIDSYLFNQYNFTSVNPANGDRLSHFHLCCMNGNTLLVKEFLKSGVDVNTGVDYFANIYAGYTPLHFVFENIQDVNTELIDLLLSYGADPNIYNADGLLSCHLGLFQNNNQIKVLLSCPKIDVYASNVFGDTALDMLLKNFEVSKKEVVEEKVKNMLQWGYELCHKDMKGKTVLHKSKHPHVIKMLLYLGADINIRDDNGKTCVQYASKDNDILRKVFDNSMIRLIQFINIETIFLEHIHLLQAAGLYVYDSNKIFYNSYVNTDVSDIIWKSKNIKLEKVKLSSKLKKIIEPSFSADYFFSEKFVVDYKTMSVSLRQKIYNFCISNDLSDFKSLSPLITLQFSKARARSRLFKPAECAFQELINRPFSDCIEPILNYLKNDDLMNLVRIKYEKLEFLPLSEDFWFIQPEIDTSL